MMVINGYQLIGELKSDHSGYAKWGFARKNGIEVFIKEFLSPIYPLDESVLSEVQLTKKRQICMDFARDKINFYNVLNKCSTGNIVTVLDFFRFGSRYYMVTEKVDAAAIAPEEICRLPFEQRLLIVKIILHCVNSLHQHGIVHGDIKPDNILFKKTKKGVYTAKIIDFDSSFLESNPPNSDEEFQGDMVYLAPESFLFIAEEEGILTRKIDVFALGILFHQYLCGKMPGFDREKYDYAFEAVLDGCPLEISTSLPEYLRTLIAGMLDKHPARRPPIEEIFSILTGGSTLRTGATGTAGGASSAGTAPHTPVRSGGLKINMPGFSTPKKDDEFISTEASDASPAPAATPKAPEMREFFKKADSLL